MPTGFRSVEPNSDQFSAALGMRPRFCSLLLFLARANLAGASHHQDQTLLVHNITKSIAMPVSTTDHELQVCWFCTLRWKTVGIQRYFAVTVPLRLVWPSSRFCFEWMQQPLLHRPIIQLQKRQDGCHRHLLIPEEAKRTSTSGIRWN